ncbi:hypothetical protein DFH09DRAFT_1280355, partial [Mycena vulgaris]
MSRRLIYHGCPAKSLVLRSSASVPVYCPSQDNALASICLPPLPFVLNIGLLAPDTRAPDLHLSRRIVSAQLRGTTPALCAGQLPSDFPTDPKEPEGKGWAASASRESEGVSQRVEGLELDARPVERRRRKGRAGQGRGRVSVKR